MDRNNYLYPSTCIPPPVSLHLYPSTPSLPLILSGQEMLGGQDKMGGGGGLKVKTLLVTKLQDLKI